MADPIIVAGEAVLQALRHYHAVLVDEYAAVRSDGTDEDRRTVNSLAVEYNGKILRQAGAFD
jgi:hypothetical protein